MMIFSMVIYIYTIYMTDFHSFFRSWIEPIPICSIISASGVLNFTSKDLACGVLRVYCWTGSSLTNLAYGYIRLSVLYTNEYT